MKGKGPDLARQQAAWSFHLTIGIRITRVGRQASHGDAEITGFQPKLQQDGTADCIFPFHFRASSISSMTRSGFIFCVGRGNPRVSPLAWNPFPSTSTKIGL